MRVLMLGLMALGLPAAAQAVQPAQPWCPVSPAAAAAGLPAVTAQLAPLLDSQPAPMARIHTEGTLDHQGIRDESIQAKKQLPIMRDAALAWRAGGGDAYYTLASRYLNAWIDIYKPAFNPIDETNFDAMIETFAILQPQMDEASRTRARAYFTAWTKGYIDAIESHLVVSPSLQATSWDNNWQSHRLKLITLMAVALDDQALFAEARKLYRAQIANNIYPSGEVRDFAERDALHYVTYDVEPLMQAALAAKVRGEDWYHYEAPSGSSLAKALAWLRPYAAGETPHEEFRNSRVPFDAQRAAAGEKGYSGPFEPKSAGTSFWLASAFEPSYLPLARQLKPQPPVFLALCGT